VKVCTEGEVYYNYQMSRDGFEELPGLSVFCKDDAGEAPEKTANCCHSCDTRSASFQ
jgi:predicted dithiol-disulfide oxidoreductase (DUF899 family)